MARMENDDGLPSVVNFVYNPVLSNTDTPPVATREAEDGAGVRHQWSR